MSARTWTLAFSAPAKMQTTNTAKHWSTASTARSTFRTVMYYRVLQAKLPRGLDRVRVEVEMRFPGGPGSSEATNYLPLVGKPILDSLASPRRYQIKKGKRAGTWVTELGYGLIPDDNPKRHLHCQDCPHMRVSNECGAGPFGELVVTITDCSAEVSNAG